MNFLKYMSPVERAFAAVALSNSAVPFVFFLVLHNLHDFDTIIAVLGAIPGPVWLVGSLLYGGASVVGYGVIKTAKRREREVGRQKVKAARRQGAAGELLTTCLGCGAVKKAGRSACPECGDSPSIVKHKAKVKQESVGGRVMKGIQNHHN